MTTPEETASRPTERSGLRTQAVHAGVRLDPMTAALCPSIFTAVTFAARYGDIGFSAAGTVEERVPYCYAREGHPNARQLDALLATIARSASARLIIDSTFASPIATQPLKFGADFVVHSLTKYCGGHGDAVGGAVIGRDATAIKSLRDEIGVHLGAMLSPFNAWLIMRGIETLPIRMEA